MDKAEFYYISDTLKLILLPLPISTVSIGIAVPVGAINESDNEYGIAHLLEHMIFAGTKTKTSIQIDKEVEAMGAIINAYTNYYETVYYIHGNGKYSIKLIDIILDIYNNSIYPEDELKREKNVVSEEIKTVYENSPGVKSYLTAIDILYSGVNERLRHHVAGYSNDILKYTRDNIINFKNKNYKEGYLVVSGHFDKDVILNFLKKKFKSSIKAWKPSITKTSGKLIIPYAGNLNRIVKIDNNIVQSYVSFYFRSVNNYSKWITHVGVLSYILTGNLNSMLSKVLRKDMGAVYSVDSYQRTHKDSGYFVIQFSCNKDLTDKCINAVWTILDEVKKGNIEPSYLSVVKNLRETRNLFIFENYDNYFDMVVNSLLNKKDLPNPKKVMNRIKSVKLYELKCLANKLFDKIIAYLLLRDKY